LLLQNLVKWSKSHMQGFAPHAERIEASLLTRESIDLLQNMAGEKNIIIRNHATDNLSWMADLEMTKLVLRNTLSNAIKFSHPNSSIDVRAKKENGFLILSVKDEGVGMTQEEVDRLFTMKVKSTPGTADERGTGIGMYITHEFVLLNKGEIKIESKKGKGTTVSISLPEGNH
jgi:two-component system sensor histidine kinase/response regulator